LEGRPGSLLQGSAGLLQRDYLFNSDWHRHGFFENQSSKSALLDRDCQWIARAVSFGRHSDRGVRSHDHARAAKSVVVTDHGWNYYACDVWRRDCDVCPVRAMAIISGRLFFRPCGNLLCFAFCHDRRRPSSGHPDLIYLLSPTRDAPPLCCSRRVSCSLSQFSTPSFSVSMCISFCFLVPWIASV